MKNYRIESIDILRGFAIILVVLGHIVESNGQPNSILYNWIYSFHMPLFMCISGFVTRHSYQLNSEFNKGHLLYVYKKFRSIMVPYLVWGALIQPFFFTNIQNKLDYISIMKSMFVTNTSFWFLPCIFGLIIIFSIYMGLKRIIRKKSWLIDFTILLILIINISGSYYFTHYDFLRSIQSYFLPFFIGVYAAENDKFRKFTFSNVHTYAIAIVIFSLVVGFFGVNTGVLNKFIRLITGILSLPICFYFVKHINFPVIVKNQLIFIGRNTLAVYLMHYYFLNAINLSAWKENNVLINIFFLIISIMVIYICIGLSKFFEINPILSTLVLGKNKKS